MSKTTQKKKQNKLKEQKKEILFEKLTNIEEFESFDFTKECLYLLDPTKDYSLDFYFLGDKDLTKEYITKYPEHKYSKLVGLIIGFYCEDEVRKELKEIKNLMCFDADVDSESYITSYKNLRNWIEQKIQEEKIFKKVD